MKRTIALLLSMLMILTCFSLASCGKKAEEKPAEEPAQEEPAAEEPAETEDQTDPVNGAIYGYDGEDPVVAAVYQYLVEHAADNFDIPANAVTIPIVQIIATEEDKGDALVYGNYYMMNYEIDGDTLKCISGGAFPGKLTCIQVGSGYSGKELEVCEDGGGFEESAKKIFGKNYDTFMQVQADENTRELARAEIIASYVKANKLDVTKYQDEGQDPVEIPQ